MKKQIEDEQLLKQVTHVEYTGKCCKTDEYGKPKCPHLIYTKVAFYKTGYYCNLFHWILLEIHAKNKDKYVERCWKCEEMFSRRGKEEK